MARVTSGRYTGFVRFDQVNRLTGTQYRLYDLDALGEASSIEGFDTDGFISRVEDIHTRWVLECIEHDRLKPAESLFEARTKMGHPELWCRACQDAVRNDVDYELPELSDEAEVKVLVAV